MQQLPSCHLLTDQEGHARERHGHCTTVHLAEVGSWQTGGSAHKVHHAGEELQDAIVVSAVVALVLACNMVTQVRTYT